MTPAADLVSPSVPAPLTPLVGRDAELDAAGRLLPSTRLLTLTGAGGSGKTRLAIAMARAAASQYRDGVAWVELAPLNDPDLLAAHIGTALHIEMGARPALDALLDALRATECLLVLDNCEHLVDACAALAEPLLARASGVRILATSREALGVPGERAWLVPTLATPSQDATTAEAVLATPAGELFVHRATSAHAAFRLTDDNAGAVASICRRLDGLPLAIELAAARVRALAPDQIAARLDRAFDVLTRAPRASVARHRTLGEAIDWSYSLLEEGDRAVLQQLSVFAGDFSLEAAETVCAPSSGAGDAGGEVLDRLVLLVDKSLVVMVEGDNTARYRLLETIRQFAAARLDATGEGNAVRARHARFYLAMVREAEPHLITAERRLWADRLMREMDNLRTALEWMQRHDPGACLQLAGALTWAWYSSGLWFEGRRWLETALAHPVAIPPSPDRATALLGAGILAGLQGQPAVARPWLEEAASIFADAGDRRREAYALGYLGITIGQEGDARAVEPAQRALAIFRELGDLYGQRLSLLVLVTMHLAAGQLPEAQAVAQEAAQVARAFGAPRELGIALQIQGTVAFHAGDLASAAALMGEALDALQQDPQILWIARIFELLALVAGAEHDFEHATRLYAAANAQRALIGAVQFTLDQQRLAPHLKAALHALGEARFTAAWNHGSALPINRAIEEAQARLRKAESDRADEHRSAPAPQDRTPLSGAPTAPGREPARPADAAPPVLDVAALGALEIRRDGAAPAPELWRHARARELLVFLLSHPEGRTREQLGVVFWPDASAAQVKNSFHVLLHHLRRALGRADLITFERNRYRVVWELGVRFDAAEFADRCAQALRAVQLDDDDAAAADALVSALALYRGEFLSGEPVGDWHLEQRDVLHRLYVDALLALGRRAQRAGHAAVAAQWYRRVVQADPLHEGGHRRLMRALARAGERGEALQHYERLLALLQREAEAVPEARTVALYDALRRDEEV